MCVGIWGGIHRGILHAAPEPLFETSFAKGAWNPADWTLVKTPRSPNAGEWIQKESCIQNKTPEGPTPKELADSWTSMVLNRKFSGKITVKSTMDFSERMAPLIVLAPTLGADTNGVPEYREHLEVVLWDMGINIWHHYFENGKPFWKLVAYERFTLKPDTRYELTMKYSQDKGDKTLSVLVDGHEFGYMDNSLPDEFYVGIAGCEGRNRFYDFAVSEGKR